MKNDFFGSLSYYIEGFHSLYKYNLWGFAIRSGLISLLIGLALLGVGVYFTDTFSMFLLDWIPLVNRIPYFNVVINILVFIMMLLMMIFLYKHILILVIGTYMGKLSLVLEEKIEGISSSKTNDTMSLFFSGISFEIRLIRKGLFWIILMFLLGFIPVVGIVFPIVLIVIQAYHTGSSNVGAYLSARKYNKSEILHFIKNNRALTIGNGMIFLLLLMIPLFGLFFAPSLSIMALTHRGIRKNES